MAHENMGGPDSPSFGFMSCWHDDLLIVDNGGLTHIFQLGVSKSNCGVLLPSYSLDADDGLVASSPRRLWLSQDLMVCW